MAKTPYTFCKKVWQKHLILFGKKYGKNTLYFLEKSMAKTPYTFWKKVQMQKHLILVFFLKSIYDGSMVFN